MRDDAESGGDGPPYPPGGELVFRLDLRSVTVVGSEERSVPRLYVNGNPTAYRWLSEFFGWLAVRPVPRDTAGRPVPGFDYVHLSETMVPTNTALSDEFECSFYRFHDETRDEALAGLEEGQRLRGNHLTQMAEFLRRLVRYGRLGLWFGDRAVPEVADLQLAVAEVLAALMRDRPAEQHRELVTAAAEFMAVIARRVQTASDGKAEPGAAADGGGK